MFPNPPTGMRAFTIIWAGQVVSLLGSAMTWFAFTIWAWQKTGQASTLASISFFAFLPGVLLTPIAGALVDRWNRKRVMLLSDAATAIGTFTALLLYATDRLEIWHVAAIAILAGFFTAFQYPAYSASVALMLPKEQFSRAQGMLGLAPAISTIFGPVLAAALLGIVGMTGIMLIDLATFLAAFLTLMWVHVPQPPVSATGLQSRGSLWKETLFGFGYIRRAPSLLSLTILFMLANFFLAIGATLIAPMLLSRSASDENLLAAVQSIGAFGGILGGAIMSIWGGPQKRITGILLGGAGACLLGVTWLGLGTTLVWWATGSFFFSFFEPFVEGGNLAIWQTKIEPDIQGKVLSARQLLTQIPYLLGVLASGFLAEKLFEPLMRRPNLFSNIFGTGPGSGMSALMVASGLAAALIFLIAFTVRPIRQVETLLPDQT